MYFVSEVKSSFSMYVQPKDSPLISINTSRDNDINVIFESLDDKSTKTITSFNELVEFYNEQDCYVVGLYKKSPTEFKVEFYNRDEAKVMQYVRFRFSKTMKTGLNYSYNFLHYVMSRLQIGVDINDRFSDDFLYINNWEIRFHSGIEMIKFDFIDKKAFFKQLTKLMVLRKDKQLTRFDDNLVSYCQTDVNITYDLLQNLMQMDLASVSK